jgi:2-dehydro-3-deoxygluconokinase
MSAATAPQHGPSPSERLDVISFGQASLDTIHDGQNTHADLVGGPAVYVAVLCAALGLRSGLVTRVGDSDRELFLRLLANTGVDTSGFRAEAGRSTRIVLHYSGQKFESVAVDEGVGKSLGLADVPTEYLHAPIGHVAPAPFGAQVEVADALARAGALVTFDPHADFDRVPLEQTSRILQNVDLFFANEDETISLAKAQNRAEAIERIHRAGVETVVVTRGSQGALISGPEGVIEIPAIPPRRYASAVGAGEAFKAGFFLGLRHLLPLRECGLLGAASASCSLECVGLASVPGPSEIHERLASSGLSVAVDLTG